MLHPKWLLGQHSLCKYPNASASRFAFSLIKHRQLVSYLPPLMTVLLTYLLTYILTVVHCVYFVAIFKICSLVLDVVLFRQLVKTEKTILKVWTRQLLGLGQSFPGFSSRGPCIYSFWCLLYIATVSYIIVKCRLCYG